MSRTARFVGGLGYGYLNQLLLVVASLWLTPFYLGRLGELDFGLWSIAVQILAYLLLLDLGIVAILPRETAYALGRAGGDPQRADLAPLIRETLRLVLLQLPLVALASLAVFGLLPERWQRLEEPLEIVLVGFVLLFPARMFPAVLQGLQELSFLGSVRLVAWALSTGLIVILVWRGVGLEALAIGWLVLQAIEAGAAVFRLARRYPHVLPRRPPRLRGKLPWKRLSQCGWVSVAQVAQVLVIGSEILVLGQILGPVAIVPYVLTSKLVNVLNNQPLMLMQAAFPALSELREAESKERTAQVSLTLGAGVTLFSGAIVCAILAVNRDFVGWWVGADRFAGLGLTLALVVAMLVRHWNVSLTYLLFSHGFERRISLTTLADGLVTVTTAILLARPIGILAAPFASLAGVCLVSLPLNLRALARALGLSAGTLAASNRPFWWRTGLVALLAWGVATAWPATTFLEIAAKGALVLGAFAAVTAPAALRSPMAPYFLAMVHRLRSQLGGPPAGAA